MSLRIVIVSCSIILASIAGCQSKPQSQEQTASPDAIGHSTPAGIISVDELAARPEKYLGPISVIGVVASHSKQNFTLIDEREYKACGLSCLSQAGTKKIPVLWPEEMPVVGELVAVSGTLSQSEKGLTFSGKEVTKK